MKLLKSSKFWVDHITCSCAIRIIQHMWKIGIIEKLLINVSRTFYMLKTEEIVEILPNSGWIILPALVLSDIASASNNPFEVQ